MTQAKVTLEFSEVKAWRGFDDSIKDVSWYVFESEMTDISWGFLIDTGENASNMLEGIFYKEQILCTFSHETTEGVMEDMRTYCKDWTVWKPDDAPLTEDEQAMIDRGWNQLQAAVRDAKKTEIN